MARPSAAADARAAAIAVVRRLRDSGHTAYFAGGCVRDELLGLAPTDYDVATDATPDRIRALFRRTQEVGAAFGVILVTPGREEGASGAATVEVATFRSEGPYSDRRRPDSVTFSDPRSDAQRRDFTINALFIDPLAPSDPASPAHAPPRGHVIDFVGGLADLDQRIIRAVGDAGQRLAEDHLRALRAVRFAARLGFTLDPGTAEAIRAHVRELGGLSRERIGEEVRRMLDHPSRAEAVRLLESLSLDAAVLTEPARTVLGPGDGRGVLNQLGPILLPFPTALAAWALDRGLQPTDAPATAALLSRWRRALCLSNDEHHALGALLQTLGILETTWPALSVPQQKRLAGADGPRFGEALRLLAARDPAGSTAVRDRVAVLAATRSGLRPEPLVTGDDLVSLGFTPGPAFKTILDLTYDAQLEDRLTGRAEAISYAAELARRPGV